jgi:hypothetical protein
LGPASVADATTAAERCPAVAERVVPVAVRVSNSQNWKSSKYDTKAGRQ